MHPLPFLTPDLAAAVADGPKRTTSLVARQTPLAHPDEQLRVLRAVDIDGRPPATGDFCADLAASGQRV